MLIVTIFPVLYTNVLTVSGATGSGGCGLLTPTVSCLTTVPYKHICSVLVINIKPQTWVRPIHEERGQHMQCTFAGAIDEDNAGDADTVFCSHC